MKEVKSTLILICILLLSNCKSSITPIEVTQDNAQSPPNIVLIMGDDMGYSDIGCYGSEINTPVLDNLAENGLRFTQFYNSARCCPTRASLLTGLYPQQAGIGHMVDDRGTPAFKGDLAFNAVTIAEALKGAGYSNYISGKWHVTPYVIDNPTKHNWPLQRGFDRFYGMVSGAGSLYDPRSMTLDNEYVAVHDDFYSTKDFTDYAIQVMDEHKADNPFFLYVSYQAAHWPLQAYDEDIAKYKGRYDSGWDKLREDRFQRMKEMGLIKPDWQLTPRDSFVMAWEDNVPDRDWEIANMEVYAAMIDYMDFSIGRIVDKLKADNRFENTLIIYLQDNGACAEELDWTGGQPKEKDLIPMKPEELQTKMIPDITRQGEPVKLMKDGWPGPRDGYTAYGLDWANASNTPFREYKHWVHEGGISSPLIVSWPNGFTSKGEDREEPTHLIDLMATFVDVGGGDYPEKYNGNVIQPMEGKSLLPAFNNLDLNREAIYWEHEGNRAVRMDKWKLISKASKRQAFVWDKVNVLDIKNWELFDMEKDRTEMNDVASSHPQMVAQMASMWQVWGERTGIIPRPYFDKN